MPTTTVKMPQAKPSMNKGTIVRWAKKAGDQIKKGDVLLVVEWDEGMIEVEAGAPGTLSKILVPEGTTIAVNTPIAEMGETGIPAVTSSAAASPAAPTQAAPKGKVIPVVMPKAGQSMEEGTIVKWRVTPGTVIKKGDVIFEIETDKATLEVEAVDEGRLAKITVGEGGCVKVLEPVAYLADNDSDVDAFIASQGAAEPTETAQAAEVAEIITDKTTPSAMEMAAPAVREDGRVRASPAARSLSAQRGIDLSTLGAGSGPGGRILSTDIPASAAAASTKPQTCPTPAVPPMPVAEGEIVRKRMSGMRKAIARNLLASKQNIPHFYIRTTIVADQLYAFYQLEKAKYPCSLNDVVILACAKAIQQFPAFRSQLDKEKDEVVIFPNANIGIAVGIEDGLVVPVLMAAEKLTLKQIGSETKRIATAARGGKIEGMGKGVFTITNLGMFGTEEFSAIINPPEAAILAVGALREEVIVSGGTMRPGRKMTMTLSADHRLIDGMLAAKFMARLKELLEYPQQLI